MNLYRNEPPYELTLLSDNGRAIVRRLELTDEGFSLTFREAVEGMFRMMWRKRRNGS